MLRHASRLAMATTILTSLVSYAETQTPSARQTDSYLKVEDLPNSLLLVGPPPDQESPAFALDQALSQRALSLRQTVAWNQAILDADIKSADGVGAFSCALGVPLSVETSPRLVKMLLKMMPDAGRATAPTKQLFKRQRPFVFNGQPICTPAELDYFLRDGSYPAGHSSIGTAWALALTEIAPDRADALIARGISLGLSRVVCNLHWLSDVRAGRELGAYTLARLHALDAFRADLAAAKNEVHIMREAGLKPNRDCESETAAIALQQAIIQEVLEGRMSQEGSH